MLKVRTVPRIEALSGTMLVVVPVWISVTDRTAVSIGRLLRVMIDCSACTRWVATSTGSMPRWGMAACVPLPWIVISNSLDEAMIGPGVRAKVPTAMPGQL